VGDGKLKSEERIKEMLKMYEFDRMMEKSDYSGFPNYQTPEQDLIINILKWVLKDGDD
jgi:hypothetical protein